MANYVKFMRGTPAAYLALPVKEPDTIYFVYEEENTYGDLYIGSRKVASNISDDTGAIATKLNELADVDVSLGLTDGQLLAWNAAHAKWEPMTLAIFGGATDSTYGSAGLVPAPKPGDITKFLKGDGTWAELPLLASLTYKIVNSVDEIDLSAEDADKYIYLVKNNDIYDEYLVIEGKVELIGNNAISLDGYMTTTAYETDIAERLNNYIDAATYQQNNLSITNRLNDLEDITSWKTL